MTVFTARVELPVTMTRSDAVEAAGRHIGKELKFFGAEGKAIVTGTELRFAPTVSYDPRPPEKQDAWLVELTVQVTAEISWPTGTYSIGSPRVRPV